MTESGTTYRETSPTFGEVLVRRKTLATRFQEAGFSPSSLEFNTSRKELIGQIRAFSDFPDISHYCHEVTSQIDDCGDSSSFGGRFGVCFFGFLILNLL